MSESLTVMADGVPMGALRRDGKRLGFTYEPTWLESPLRFPLSLSMPLARKEHPHSVVEPFLWGLLPDNAQILEEWSKRFHVSPRNVFSIVRHVGEDCAGAVQFFYQGEGEVHTSGTPRSGVHWIDENDLAHRITLLLENHGSTRLAQDTGQFSLAGAQPKLALHRHPASGAWGVPEGSTPTTHILKPATGEFGGHMENEHFCLRLAAAVGLRTCQSKVMQVGGHTVIVIERYDRLWREERCLRVHQEDTCQSFAVYPDRKYQNEGGPGARKIAELLRDQSSNPADDLQAFADALIFNWLIAGTDAHSKNYSLLIAPGSQVRMAPLYDLASVLPYPQRVDLQKAKLAMKIGNTYRLRDIRRNHWEACARDLRMPANDLIGRAESMIDRLTDAAPKVADILRNEGLDDPIISLLVDSINAHARNCRESLADRL